ncbi:MAG: hypothetical protein IID40_07830, partial [Planctomycetes bacterium]|nr:hypothetical protein [Planctomycetota bacterium]
MLTKRALGETVRAAVSVVVMLGLPLLLAGGCTGTFGGGDGDSGGSGGEAGSSLRPAEQTDESARIIGLATDLAVSGSQVVTIPYYVPTTATNVRAFYLKPGQEENVHNLGAEEGDDRGGYFNFPPLAAGNSTFTIDTGDLPRGDWVIGISYIENGTSMAAFSNGLLKKQGLPEPTIHEPVGDIDRIAGEKVRVIADMGDPEADVA